MIIAAFDVGETTGICIVDSGAGLITDHYCVPADQALRSAVAHSNQLDTILVEQFPNVVLEESVANAYADIVKLFYFQGVHLIKPSLWKPVFKKLKIKLPCKNAQHDFDAYGMVVYYMFRHKMINYGDLRCEVHPR